LWLKVRAHALGYVVFAPFGGWTQASGATSFG